MTEFKGSFLWYELMTEDVEAARNFYTEVIGWGTQRFEMGERPYTMWTVGERPIGGLDVLPDEAKRMGAPPHWMAYVGTPDVDATTRQAVSLGGEVLVPPMDIPTVGRWSLIADPQGATLAAFCPVDAEVTHDPDVGDFSWHELATTDPEAAWRYYEALFGWKRGMSLDMGPLGPYHLFMADEHQGGGVFRLPSEAPRPFWLFYIRVADLDATLRRVEALGGKVLAPPQEVPGGDRVAPCLDPQGAAFALHQKKA